MKQEALSALKKELEQNFGRKIISYRDCVQLVEDIYQKTESTVNVNTLRRFFGLVKTNYTASRSTLLILSKYCGFNSPDEIENFSEKKEADASINKGEVLHYMISLFRHTTVSSVNDYNFEQIIQQTILFLERNPDLIDKFQREIAKTATGQYYYFERCVNMDRLNKYYGDGLKYYVRSKNSVEAKIFANSLLVFRYWLTDNFHLLEKHFKEIITVHDDSTYPPHIMGRYLAARLFYAHAKNESPDKILMDAINYYNAFISEKKEAASYPYFELLLCEALTLTNQKNEAIEWLNRGKSSLPEKEDSASNPYTIWEYILNYSNTASTTIRNFILTLKKNKQRFLSSVFNKNYLRILQLSIEAENKRNEELNSLVGLTGYKRLIYPVSNYEQKRTNKLR